MVDTAVFRNARGLPGIVRMLAPLLQRAMAISPDEAARTPVFLAQDDAAVGTGGRFYGPGLERRPIPQRALRSDRRNALWAASEALVQLYLPAQAAVIDEQQTLPLAMAT